MSDAVYSLRTIVFFVAFLATSISNLLQGDLISRSHSPSSEQMRTHSHLPLMHARFDFIRWQLVIKASRMRAQVGRSQTTGAERSLHSAVRWQLYQSMAWNRDVLQAVRISWPTVTGDPEPGTLHPSTLSFALRLAEPAVKLEISLLISAAPKLKTVCI